MKNIYYGLFIVVLFLVISCTHIRGSNGSEKNGMVFVEGGTFQMGNSSDYNVTVSSFYIGRTEVTQREYENIMGKNPSYFNGRNLPVVNLSWYDAIEYCNMRSLKEGLKPVYVIDKNKIDPNNTSKETDQFFDNLRWLVTWDRNANGYRLPTEAEWEYAAKGGHKATKSYQYSGSNFADDVAWYSDNSKNKIHPVAAKAPNILGLYDMSGNASEYCWDWYGEYNVEDTINPTGSLSGNQKIHRGGFYTLDAHLITVTSRRVTFLPGGGSAMGLRLVRSSF